MRRSTLHAFFFISFVFSGCVSISYENKSQSVKPSVNNQETSLTNINKIAIGMTKDQAASVMTDKVRIGYEEGSSLEGALKEITVKNPYRAEVFEKAGRRYEVLYYFTHIVKSDGIISEEELTPVVFERNAVIGKGWNDLFKLKNQKP